MCPEKERYLRIARIQVSQFETDEDGSKMDHALAIKQYSRSAADAEIPLPQDLRPETTLKMTMTYLLHNIMNLCDDENVEVGEWYHFVWDRTRGIRKDITQQELCSPVCVELVEQCVRFHIHCAARLIAEPPGVFDQKINTENLTKCLQTLKYMYDDLKLKNIDCPNEAEFRAYVILLNLNDSGNFLWEIKQLNQEIMKSDEIKFALDCYFAVSCNNYVKFFNLVREAPYLSACILIRYFTQVRLEALQILMSSYTPRKVGFYFSLSYIEKVLYFEDLDATTNFLTQHGITYEDDNVYLDRQMLRAPETPFIMERCYNTVESKMDSEVAEIICGGELPSADSFLENTPHSSFDRNGLFKRESMLAIDQNGTQLFADQFIFKPPKTSPSLATKSRPKATVNFGSTSNPFLKSSTFELSQPSPFSVAERLPTTSNISSNNIFEVQKPQQQAMSIPTVVGGFSFAKTEKPTNTSFNSNWNMNQTPIFGSNKNDNEPKQSTNFFAPSKLVEKSLVDEEKKRQEWLIIQQKEREVLEAEKKIKEANEKLKQEQERLKAVEEERKREEQELARRLKNEQEEALRLKLIQKAEEKKLLEEKCQNILDEIIDDVVNEIVENSSKFSVHLYVKIPEEFYEAMEFDVTVEEIFKIFQQEQLAYINKTKLKYETLQRSFRLWRQITAKEKIRRAKLESIGCVVMNQSLEEFVEEIRLPQQKESLWNKNQYVLGKSQTLDFKDFRNEPKINLFEHLRLDYNRNLNIFWKILVSLPKKNEESCLGFSCYIDKWFSTIMDYQKNEEIFIRKSSIGINQANICIRKVHGKQLTDENSKKSLKNSNSIIFIASFGNLQSSRLRLQNLLDQLEYPTPISMIFYNSHAYPVQDDDIETIFDLTNQRNVSDFQINVYNENRKFDGDLREFLLISFQSLYNCYREKISGLSNIRMQHIVQFLDITMGDEMWKRVEISCRENEIVREKFQNLNDFIELHNFCVDKSITMITKPIENFPSIAEEFKAELPTFNHLIHQTYEYFPDEWRTKAFRDKQIEFVKSLKLTKLDEPEFKSLEDFKQKIQIFITSNIKNQREKIFHIILSRVLDNKVNLKLFDHENLLKYSTKNVFWLNLMKEILVVKINESFANSNDLPSLIIYDKIELSKFRQIPWWKSLNISLRVKSIVDEPPAKKIKQTTNLEIEELLKRSRNCLKTLDERISKYSKLNQP